MSKFYVCPLCNCSLDFNEKCDCSERSEQLRKKYELLTSVNSDGQIEIGGLCYENYKN